MQLRDDRIGIIEQDDFVTRSMKGGFGRQGGVAMKVQWRYFLTPHPWHRKYVNRHGSAVTAAI